MCIWLRNRKKEKDQKELENTPILYKERQKQRCQTACNPHAGIHRIPCAFWKQGVMENTIFPFCLIQLSILHIYNVHCGLYHKYE